MYAEPFKSSSSEVLIVSGLFSLLAVGPARDCCKTMVGIQTSMCDLAAQLKTVQSTLSEQQLNRELAREFRDYDECAQLLNLCTFATDEAARHKAELLANQAILDATLNDLKHERASRLELEWSSCGTISALWAMLLVLVLYMAWVPYGAAY